MKRALVTAFVIAGTLAAAMNAFTVTAAQSCESLASLKLQNTTITMAQVVPAEGFSRPSIGTSAAEQGFSNTVAFCRVAATLTPSSDSDIKVEVWLPTSGWNGKFQAVGNGGLAGVIPYPALAAGVTAGYASAGTDTGHVADVAEGAAFALGHPEKMIDHGYRAIHEMTVKAKAIVGAYYGGAPTSSFFNACSTGGRQGLAEAQRYPADFDGIVAGASSWNQMRLHAARIALNLTVNKNPDSVIPPSKYPMIHDAVLNACDALDGVKDGVLEDPTRCHFDVAKLSCQGTDKADCLTKGQVESARAMTSEIKDPSTGAVLYEGHLWPGSELGWARIGGPEPSAEALTAMKNIVLKNPGWDYHRMLMSADVDRAAHEDRGPMYAGDPNLRPFIDRGGKLLMYHGWSDPQVTPQNSLMYYESAVKAVGKDRAATSIALFMVPGMNHCQGGPGTDTFDKMAAIEQWVLSGKAPNSIPAFHNTDGKPDRTRPLCAYPKVAVYKGTGSTDEAANFMCKMP
jgi:feruloyl esterase